MKLQTLTAILVTFGLQAACLQPGVRKNADPSNPNAPAQCFALVTSTPSGFSSLQVWGESALPVFWEVWSYVESYGVRTTLHHTTSLGFNAALSEEVDRCKYAAMDVHVKIWARDAKTDALIGWNEAFAIRMY